MSEAPLISLLVTHLNGQRFAPKIIGLKFTRCFLLWGVCSVLGGCGIYSNTLDAVNSRTSSFQAIADQATAQGKSLGWDEAVKLLLKKNPQILSAKLQQDRSERNRKGYWKNYVPTARGSVGLNKSLGQLDELRLSDFDVYAFLNLRLPNPVTIRGELVALSLSAYRAACYHELVKRRQMASLYREFVSYEELRQAFEESVSLDKESSGKIEASGLIARIQRESEMSERKLRLRRSIDQISFRISERLQLTDYKIRPEVDKLPKIDYSKRYHRLESKDGYGLLALQLLATDIEAARLACKRIRLGSWPSINFSASAPQVYSSNSDTDFDIESIILFGGLAKGFDLFDDAKDRVEISEKEYEQAKSDAYYRVLRERETLRYASMQYRRLLEKKQSLEVALQINQDLFKSGIASERLLLAIQKQQLIADQLKLIKKSISNQELEFWIWDERVWK